MEQTATLTDTSIPAKSTTQSAGSRLLFIDNLRWVMIMLVISMHAAVTYSGFGGWYYKEHSVLSLPATLFFATYQSYLQSFFMALLFFVAGYFVPRAYDSKGPRLFLKDRGFRLGLPTLLYIFIIGPLTEFYISHTWDTDSPNPSFFREYGHYITHIWFPGGSGPLWFCLALLIFCAIYALVRVIRDSRKPAIRGQHPGKFPGNKAIWAVVMLITLGTFLVRLSWPKGTAFYNMQFCYFTEYIVFFIAGTLAYRNAWLTKLPRRTGLVWGRIALIFGLTLFFSLLIFGGAFQGNLKPFDGGLTWQSLGMSWWEAIAGVGVSLYCLVLFRDRFNTQGPWAKYFSANAFSVYVFHPPVLIGISLLMTGMHYPPVIKFLIASLLCIALTYALSGLLFRKIPGLRRILN